MEQQVVIHSSSARGVGYKVSAAGSAPPGSDLGGAGARAAGQACRRSLPGRSHSATREAGASRFYRFASPPLELAPEVSASLAHRVSSSVGTPAAPGARGVPLHGPLHGGARSSRDGLFSARNRKVQPCRPQQAQHVGQVSLAAEEIGRGSSTEGTRPKGLLSRKATLLIRIEQLHVGNPGPCRGPILAATRSNVAGIYRGVAETKQEKKKQKNTERMSDEVTKST